MLVKVFCLLWQNVVYEQAKKLVEKTETKIDDIAVEGLDAAMTLLCKDSDYVDE